MHQEWWPARLPHRGDEMTREAAMRVLYRSAPAATLQDTDRVHDNIRLLIGQKSSQPAGLQAEYG